MSAKWPPLKIDKLKCGESSTANTNKAGNQIMQMELDWAEHVEG